MSKSAAPPSHSPSALSHGLMMRLLHFAAIAATCAFAIAPRAAAQKETNTTPTNAEFEAKLGYRTGTITLDGDIATLRLSPAFRFINHDGAKLLLEQAWGNPPGAADGVLGMIIPANISPLEDAGWGVVVTFNEDGYVDDKDAATIDYAKLLREMQEGSASDNAERKKQGYEPVSLIGWAEKPTYDAATHKLYWAKELAFGSDTNHTLNYNVRVLGRRGVLELNAVSTMDKLASIRTDMQQVLPLVEFNSGSRYADFLPGKDKAAQYGVAGLVAGALATKAGLFKGLIALLIAGKKLVIVGIVALGAMFKKFFGKKDADPTVPTTEA
jgi:uncharacterized membrane-anchored protein